MSFASIVGMFYIDRLSIIMISLVSFIGLVIYFFSRRYMAGDALYHQFFRNMLVLLISVMLMTVADNIVLFLSAWGCCNWALVRLMVHKSTWKAAKASGKFATQHFIAGFLLIILAFVMLYKVTGSFSIQYIVNHPDDSWSMSIGLLLLLLGAMMQSAIWPCHRWLISSLNSPTPVSALMHAGVVNAGGFLLIRFAPLYFSVPGILNTIFILGLISALLGSFWKLLQNDVKRMLACSTVGQMGFMFVLCGLGLFASALAHLCWHGLFKAYLFLASGSAAQEKRLDLNVPPRFVGILLSLMCGALGGYIFEIINNRNGITLDTSLFIVAVVFIAGTQLALTVLRDAPYKRWPIAMCVTAAMAALYGANVYYFDLLLSPLSLMQPQPLTALHLFALTALILGWLFVVFRRCLNHETALYPIFLRAYVKALNSSQPHPETVTSYRKGYEYV